MQLKQIKENLWGLIQFLKNKMNLLRFFSGPKPITSFSGEFRFLSNFYIESDGSCVEIEYQRAKCSDPAERELFNNSMTPGQAKRLGRKVKLRKNWEEIKLHAMEFYVRRKFRDSDTFKMLLLDTGERELIEGNNRGDTFWGKVDGIGENHLGRILMRIRKELSYGS